LAELLGEDDWSINKHVAFMQEEGTRLEHSKGFYEAECRLLPEQP